jgi:hypothetical protein
LPLPDAHPQVIVETTLALVLGTLGASLNAPEMKEITWKEEMKTRYVDCSLCLVFHQRR